MCVCIDINAPPAALRARAVPMCVIMLLRRAHARTWPIRLLYFSISSSRPSSHSTSPASGATLPRLMGFSRRSAARDKRWFYGFSPAQILYAHTRAHTLPSYTFFFLSLRLPSFLSLEGVARELRILYTLVACFCALGCCRGICGRDKALSSRERLICRPFTFDVYAEFWSEWPGICIYIRVWGYSGF